MTFDVRPTKCVDFVYDTFAISGAREEKVEVRWSDLKPTEPSSAKPRTRRFELGWTMTL